MVQIKILVLKVCRNGIKTLPRLIYFSTDKTLPDFMIFEICFK